MPSHYDDGEYKGNEHSADIFKAPPKEKTAGEKLEESGEYIDSGEGTDAEGNLLQSVGEGALGVGKGALWGLQKYGEGIDWTNKQVNLRNALMMNPANRLLPQPDAPDWVNKVLDYSFHDLRGHTAGGIGNVVGAVTGSEKANDIAEMAGQILLPDAIDFATGGVGYLDNIARAGAKLKNLRPEDAARIVDGVFAAKRFQPKQVFEGAVKGVQEGIEGVTERVRGVTSIFEGGPGASIAGNVGTGLDKTMRELPNTLDPRGLRNWGSNKRKSGARFITGKTVQDEPAFIQAGWAVLAKLNESFGIDINRATAPFQMHHKGVIRQVAESANGLTDEAARLAGDLISKKVGFKLGYDPTNSVPLPPEFHQRVHDIINDSISGQWGDNLEGLIDIRTGQRLPRDWQTTMDLQARMDAGIYDQIADAINDHVTVIDKFWNSVATRTNLGKLSPDEYREATLEVLEADEMLKNLRRTRTPSPGEGYNITQAVNELLEKANRIDLQSPIFTKLSGDMAEEAYKFALQDNGWKALQEVLVSGQDSATVFATYGIKTKGFEKVLRQLGIPGIGQTKTLVKRRPGRPIGSKTSKTKLQKQRKKKYDEDPDLNQGNTGRDETKPMDPPPDN